MEQLSQLIQAAQNELDPQLKALKGITAALKTAANLAGEDGADALPMHKALLKLETAAAAINSETVNAAVAAFAAATQTALDNLAYDFAHDLREAFLARGETVKGRPPTLAIGLFIFQIDIAARKGQWFYGKEPLTRPIPLSLKGILRAYDQQTRRITNRTLDTDAFLAELYKTWEDCLSKKSRRPSKGRINIVELYAQLVLNRQSGRFWNTPARATFKDYERELFVRDLVLLRDSGRANFIVGGEERELRLGVATKSQAEQTNRSIWLPTHEMDGDYYGDLTFDPL